MAHLDIGSFRLFLAPAALGPAGKPASGPNCGKNGLSEGAEKVEKFGAWGAGAADGPPPATDQAQWLGSSEWL